MKMPKTIPATITTELKFTLEKEPKTGESFPVYLRTEWLSSESKIGQFYLLSSAGLGGSQLFFEANGKKYAVDMRPVFKSIIEQFLNS